jgi:hypothetical protein
MYQFLLDCYFKKCYKGRKFGVSTPRYAKSTPRHAAQLGVNTFSRISLRNRYLIQKYLRSLTSDQRGIDWGKKLRVENLVRLSL